MKILSEKLALVLMEFNEFPQDIQKNIDFYEKEKGNLRMKGDLRLFSIN